MTRFGPWLRYFQHVPAKRIIGKIAHKRKLGAALRNWTNPAAPAFSVATFSSAALMAFAQHYQAQGARFTRSGDLERGIFETKGMVQDFGAPENMRWTDPFPNDTSKVNFLHDLCFFSFAIPLATQHGPVAAQVLSRLTQTMETHHPIKTLGRAGHLPFVWSPIALALRIMGLATAAALLRQSPQGSDDGALAQIAAHIHLCEGLLDLSAERYLGYNHQVFGETALFVAALARGDASQTRLDAAASALAAGVLADGMWAEPSATYHIHMLLLAKSLLAAAQVTGLHTDLAATVTKMQIALPTLVHPDGEIAIFSDAAMQDSVPPEMVGWTHMQGARPILWLPKSGYARLTQMGTTVIMDAGPLAPDDVPGHGHGDFLSIEISFGRTRFIVDPGTASIANDAARHWTRSAALHNGPTIDGAEPAEFFGAWRVGRRGNASFDAAPAADPSGSLCANATATGYGGKNDPVRRSLRLLADGAVQISDRWASTVAGRGRTTFILPQIWSVEIQDPKTLICRADQGQMVKIAIETGIFSGLSACNWFPAGPMRPSHGTRINLHDQSGRLDIFFRPANS